MDRPKGKKKSKKGTRIAKVLVKLVISAAALYFAYTKIDVDEFLEMISKIKIGWFVIAVVCFNISKIIAAFRLRIFYENLGVSLGKVYNLKLYYLGMFYNLFLPGAIGGDAYKVYILRDGDKATVKGLTWATLADRLSGLCLLVILGAGFYFLSHFPIVEEWEISTVILLAMLGCLPVFYFLFYKFLDKRVVKQFAKTSLLSFWVQLGQVAAALSLLMALWVNSSFMDYLSLFMLSSVAAVIPLTIGGIGMRELVFLYGTEFLLIGEATAVAFAVLFFFTMAISSLIGLLFAFKPIDKDVAYI